MEASALVRTRYSGTRVLTGDTDPEYVPFPDVARRNGWQESLEQLARLVEPEIRDE